MKKWESIYYRTVEPAEEPDYMAAAMRLDALLAPVQKELLFELLESFGALVQFERKWYFHKGYQAGKRGRSG